MKSFTYTIQDSAGLHARPAGVLSKMTKKYQSTITLKTKGQEVNAGKLLAVMALGVTQGEVVTVEVEGEDEEAAYNEVSEFFHSNL